jgi:zinc-ribbon domain
MVCPNCGKEGIERGDAFCRHCGLSLPTPASVPQGGAGVAQKKPVTETNATPGEGLQLLGGAILVLIALLVFAVAPLMGWPSFGASVLPWLSGAGMLAGLVLIFVGFGLRRAH